MPVQAVAFDIDGTLYPNAAMYLKSVPFALRRLRLMFAFARVRRDVRRMRPIDDLALLQAQLLADRLGIDVRRAAERIETELYGEWERILDRVEPFPHVRQCVEGIRDAGLQVAVTSDFPVHRKLARLGLDDLFECRLWAEESGYLKPHPEPFILLAGCLGLPPEQILYVGNSYEYDIVGAKRAGMMAAHLTRRPPPDSVADFSFSEYRDLCRWVRSLVGSA
jgi:putative hydrolase of the HAD superfamily